MSAAAGGARRRRDVARQRAGARFRPARRGQSGRAAGADRPVAGRAAALSDASRYCETRQATDIAWSLFGNTKPGWARVQAINEYVHRHVTFGYEHAHHMKSAHDVYEQRAGVCRDFAHLGLALCRCMGIRALLHRLLAISAFPQIPHRWISPAGIRSIYSGQWYTFDARHNVAADRPHPDGDGPRRRRRRADHELRPDESGEVFRGHR